MGRSMALRMTVAEMNMVEESDGHFSLEVESQGKHGTKPPLADLERLVFSWLHENLSDLAGLVTRRYQNVGIPGQQRYRLQVECARIEEYSHHFVGVRVVAPSSFCKRTLLIRMRLPDETCQWKGELVCPNWHVAEAIMKRFCAESFSFLMQYVDRQLDEVRESATSGPPDLARARAEKVKNRIRHAERCVKRLERKKSLLRKFCFLLMQTGAKVNQKVPEKALKESLRAVFSSHHELAFEEARFILVRVGLLRPVGEKLDGFMVDPIVEEYADEYVKLEAEKKRQQRADRLRRLKSVRDQALREVDHLRNKAAAKERLAQEISEQIAVLEAATDGATVEVVPAIRIGTPSKNGRKR